MQNRKEKISFDEYISITSKDKRLEFLQNYWGITGNTLQGKIEIPKEDDKRFKIKNIKSLDGKVLSNPFRDISLIILMNKSNYLSDLKRVNDGDDIIFNFKVNMNLKYKEGLVIHLSNESLVVAKDIELFLSETDLNMEEIIQLIINSENAKITKVLVNEEAFRANAKKIYEDAKNEYQKETQKIYEMAQDKKVALETENDGLQSNNEVLKNEIQENNEILNEIKKEIQVANEKQERLIELGLLKRNVKEDERREKIDIEKNEYIDYIVKYLASSYKNQLYYNKSTIKKLYTALSTNQLVILSGSPGTGKTSLIEGFSDAIGAEKKIISVQPSWTETQDLIGFYNPIDKKYISTPFLDFLIEASGNNDNLYIVCLDEMNLSHVEYYFAEFLSKLESNDRELELYSEDIYVKNREEIERYIEFINKKYAINSEQDETNIDDMAMFQKYTELKSQYKNLIKYKHKITISKNIRFVGTINKDETTKNLSPKVVDRSYIMEVDKYNEETKINILENIEEYKQKYNKVLNLDSSDFGVSRTFIEEDMLDELKKISSIVNEDFGIALNNRFYKQVEEIISVGIIDKEEILDNIILTKIIPKINVYIESEDEERIKGFEGAIEDKKDSMAAFKNMKTTWQDTEVLTFWR